MARPRKIVQLYFMIFYRFGRISGLERLERSSLNKHVTMGELGKKVTA